MSVPPSVYPFDPYTYGQTGGEFDFGLTKTLPAFDPTKGSPTPSGQQGGDTGGNSGQQHPFGGNGDGSRNPWNQHGGNQGQGGQGQGNFLLNLLAHLHQGNQGVVQPLPSGGNDLLIAHGRGYADGGAIPSPAGLNNNLQYLMSGLGSLAQPTNDPSQSPAPPTGPQGNYSPNGSAQGGPGNQDDPGGTFARSNVSQSPSMKNSLAMAGLVGGMTNPLGLGMSLAGQALTGNSALTADLGPRLPDEAIQAMKSAWDSTPGPLTNKMSAANRVLQGARDKYGLPPGLTKQDIMDVTPGDMQFGGTIGSPTSSGGSPNGRGNSGGDARGGGSYGGGSLGGGPGAEGAGRDPGGPPGGWATGGIINLIRRR